ncbi:Ras- protein Rap-1A [Tritrichomonas musculus]|uniref:Ras- protein Rap-1A n=1 Tax=Tritrichomonas musculus TaxID=1915356 RepID=A0ABR2GX39_9EUKA
MQRAYMKRNDGFIILYSVKERDTLEYAEDMIKRIYKIRETNDVPMVLCSNFCLSKKRVVAKEEGEKIAKSNNIGFFETQTSKNINVKEAFEYLVRKLISKKENNTIPVENGPKKKKSFFSFLKKKQ